MKKCCLGILAHVDAGKTTLSESLLLNTGVIDKAGRVDNGDCYLDTDKMERSRGITIFSKLARFSYKDTDFVLVDTPGHVDFSAEMERTLKILDVAVLVISGPSKVQPHTKTVWKLLRANNIPTFIFVNKMDMPGVDKEEILSNLKKELSLDMIDFTLTGTDSFYEEVATGNEQLLDEYMEKGFVKDESIKEAINARKIFPVFFGSALQNEGVTALIEGLDRFVLQTATKESFGAICYKISRDKAGNRLTYLKLTGGSLKVKDMLGEEKINEIRRYSGEKYEEIREAFAGDICVIPNITSSVAGKGYGFEKDKKDISIAPVVTYAVSYDDTIDRTGMHKILQEIEEEESGLLVEYNEDTRQIFVHLMGEVQTEILTNIILDRYKVKVNFGAGRVLYRETIASTVEGVGHFEPLRHYAEVHLKMEPLECGQGLEFATEVSEEELAINWQRLVLTHLKEREHRGVLTGSPITDMKITLVAGRAHQKHTEGGDFRQATYRAVRQGLMQAESVLLEPFYSYEIIVPENCVGKAMLDIDRMCGSAIVTEQHEGMTTIVGTAPVATLNGYATELLAYTKGLGSICTVPSGYEPCHNTEEVLAERRYDPDADKRNPSYSVFCSHGAGTNILWYEVPNYMHIPFVTLEGYEEPKEKAVVQRPSQAEVFVTTEEIDDIINKTAYANRKTVQSSHKGISKELRRNARANIKVEAKDVEYKGTKEPKKRIMLIDGYNVVHAFKELNELASVDINAAAGKLADIVCNYQGMSGVETILVFDAYKVKGHNTEVIDYHNIKIVYTKTAETADHYIERYAHEHGKKYNITVVTSDGVEQVIIRGEGCILMSSREFEREVERATLELRRNGLWSV